MFYLLSFQAKESIDQLVYLCRTDREEVRDAAKQALLVLGNNDHHKTIGLYKVLNKQSKRNVGTVIINNKCEC